MSLFRKSRKPKSLYDGRLGHVKPNYQLEEEHRSDMIFSGEVYAFYGLSVHQLYSICSRIPAVYNRIKEYTGLDVKDMPFTGNLPITYSAAIMIVLFGDALSRDLTGKGVLGWVYSRYEKASDSFHKKFSKESDETLIKF